MQGNSLIRDPAVHAKAFVWEERFPAVFASGGFDVVVGNPPWERMKIQEREFFAIAAPEIASSVSAADRRTLIAAIESAIPSLWEHYAAAQLSADRTLAYVRSAAANFPLTGRGDINTYMLFAELSRQLVSPTGRVGLLVPSGIATDSTTRAFFSDLMETRTLSALYDFENKKLVFADVDGRFKFSILLMTGKDSPQTAAEFVFFAHSIDDLTAPHRKIKLSPKDLKLLNPNSRTCPIFRTRRDAELTKRIYRNLPILIDWGRQAGGNAWGVTFRRMFDQTNDAESFLTGAALHARGMALDGNRWVGGDEVYLPLYEAKMLQAYDHRAAGVRIEAGNWMRQGQPEESSLVERQNPEFAAQPRYWVPEAVVAGSIGDRPAVLAYKDVTSATNQRTMIAAMVPRVGLMNSAPVILFGETPSTPAPSIRRQMCLLANLNSIPYDFVARQKVGGLHLNFFIVEQLPTLPPDVYDDECRWAKGVTLEDWVVERALKLTCTANDMSPLAKAAGFSPVVWKWKDDERLRLRSELDAAYFHLYQLGRDDVAYVLSTFQGIVKEDEACAGDGPTRASIMQAFDRLG